jgi:hypothetical protein
MNEADDPKLYRERVKELARLTAAQKEHRAAIFNTADTQKSFFDSFKDGFAEMAGNVTAATLVYKGVSAAIGAVKDLFSGAEQGYDEAQRTQTQLQAVIRSTGGVAGETIEKLNKYQEALMNQTGVDDDVIAKGEDMLLTFTNVRGKIYEDALPAIVDMTAALNGGRVTMEGIQRTAILVGKGLNDPIAGTTAWKKAGVALDDQQKEQIKTLVKSNDMMGAQAILLKELNKEFGGRAKAISDTDVGIVQRYETRIGNIQESLGQWIVKGKALKAAVLDPFLGFVEKATSTTLPEKLQQEQSELNSLVGALAITNTNQAVRNRLIDELQTKYPDFIGNISKEAATNDFLIQKLEQVNQQYRDRIFIAVNEEKIKGIQEKRNAAIKDEAEARERVAKASGLSMTELAKLNDEQIKNIALQESAKQRQIAGFSTGQGTGGASSGTYAESKALKDVDLILNGRKRISDSFKEEADLMGANAIMQQKVRDEQLKSIDFEEKAIRKRMQAESEEAKAKDEIRLKELAAKKKDLLGIIDKPTSGPSSAEQDAARKKAEAERDSTIKGLEALAKEYEQFEASQMLNTLSKNDKEVQALADKFDKEIEKQKEGLTKKRITQAEHDIIIARMDDLAAEKKAAVNELKVKQEKDTVDAILKFNQGLTAKLQTELEKEQANINTFYDGLVRDAGANQELIAVIEKGRAASLIDAKLREEDRFQEEKRKIVADGLVASASVDDTELARINKKYDDQIAALKDKFTLELQATQEFQDTIDAINRNRKNEIDKSNEDEEKKKSDKRKEAALQAAQDISNAVFTITQRNRQAQSDAEIKKLEDQKEVELSNKDLTESQKKTINDKYAKEEAEIKRKAWEADKTAALEQAVINGALAVVKALPNVFLSVAAGIAAAAQIAIIAAQPTPKFAKGGAFVPRGPSHADGGINLVNNKTGQPIAEMEGGEPIMILSKDTYKNNAMLVNELLYNSQYRNGAPVSVNSTYATRPANSMLSSGGVVASSSTGAPGSGVSSSTARATNTDMSHEKLDEILQEFKAFREKPWEFPMRQFLRENENINQINNDTKA